MSKILESIFKGFAQWLYSLGLEIVQYIANSLLDVFSMDLGYFRRVTPVTDDILSIVMAAGWALLLGNLVFQAVRSMASGLGFEGEDPKLLFMRTFVFGFLLLASPQVCEIGLGISASVIELLQVPNSVTISLPEEDYFNIGASWLLVIIVNFVIMWQIVKLFFEIAERYVVTAALVLLSPLAFATGGSKNTADIFKGWCRMFGSMCLMMVLNVVFLKLLLSAMGHMPSDVGVLPWMLLIVGIARVARKADSIVARMGLNPAITGDGLGRGLPGMVAYAVVKSVGSTVAKTVSHSAGKNGFGKSTGPRRSNGPTPGGRSNPPPTPPPVPPSGGGSGASRPAGNGSGGSAAPAGNGQGGTNTGAGTAKPAASYAKGAGRSSANSTTENSSTSTQHNTNTQQAASGQGPAQQPVPGSGAKAQRTAPPGTRRTSVPPGTKTAWQNTPRPSGAGPAPTAAQAASAEKTGSAAAQAHQQEKPERPPIPRVGQNNTGPGRPPTSGGGQAPKGGGRRTSTIHTASQTASTAATGTTSATHTSTQTTAQQQGQASRPIWQNGTPVISPPPGVGVSGKGANSRPKGAGTRKTSAPAQPHVSGETASSGTAGTRRTSAPTQPPIGGRVSPSGTAGTGKAPVTSQPPVSGVAVPSDMTGTRKTSVSTQPPIGGRASPPGTAGMGKAPVSNQPPVNGGATPSGTARTRKTSVPTQPPIGGRAATSGTAGTGKAPVSNQPPVSGEAASSGTAGTRKASAPTQPPIGGRASPSGTAGTGKAPITSQPPVSGGAASSGTAGTHKTAVPSQPPIGGRGAPPGTAGKAVPKSGPNTGTKRVKSTPAQAAMNGTAGHKKNTRRKKGGTDIG